MIKKLITTFIIVMTTVVAMAQTPARFTFMGIPVDGKKTDFINKLQQKGFVYNYSRDRFKGKFNGLNSTGYISENHGKVDRVCLLYGNLFDESNKSQVIRHYNNLLQQFQENEKYFEDFQVQPILENEDISYEITIHKKDYVASFLFNPFFGISEEDKTKMFEPVLTKIEAELNSGKYDDLIYEEESKQNAFMDLLLEQKMIETDLCDFGVVWFCISEQHGKYYIMLYYDNLLNRPNGEDL